MMSEENKNTRDEGYDFDEGFEYETVQNLFSDEPPKNSPKKIKLSTFIISSVALVLAAVMITFTALGGFYRKSLEEIVNNSLLISGETEGLSDDLELLASLFKTYSYFDIDNDEIAKYVLKAYAYATGDRYAEYYTAEEYEILMADRAGESQGIGIKIIYTTVTIGGAVYDVIKVANVMKDSPAAKAGLKVGDYIFYVGADGEDQKSVHELGYAMAFNSLRGKAGTEAEFTVFRPNSDGSFEKIPFKIMRAAIVTTSVMGRICETDSSVAVIKITEFDMTTPTQLTEVMDAYVDAGIEKFVFDVRYNPGGSLSSIVAVLSYFLDSGDTIISEVDKSGKSETISCGPIYGYVDEYSSCNVSVFDIGKYKGFSYAVICNEDTASAAELFVANFRDHDLGKIVGVKTFGKGSVQNTIPLEYFGYEGALKLTTKMYFPPSGEGYDGIGIEPDVKVELSETAAATNVYELKDADDDQLLAAIKTFN